VEGEESGDQKGLLVTIQSFSPSSSSCPKREQSYNPQQAAAARKTFADQSSQLVSSSHFAQF
jgi:hypothetical protein